MGTIPPNTTVIDDRGAARPLLLPVLRPEESDPAAAFRSRNGTVVPPGFRTPSHRFRLLAVAATITLLWFWPEARFGPAPVHAALVAAILLLAIVPESVWNSCIRLPSSRRERVTRRRRELLRQHRCPSCGTDLSETARDADGCTPCPSCDAAWRVGSEVDGYPPSTCPRCSYSLAGLPTTDRGTVRCPECSLSIPERAPTGASPAAPVQSSVSPKKPCCWGCGRTLRGLELRYGDRVQCPDCGQWRSGLTAAEVATPPDP